MKSDSPVPVVDVLIPAYNAENTILESLQSIQQQTVRDIRIVVVNDGSTDRTSQIAHAAAERDPRVMVIDQPNGGIVGARNRLIEHSRAPFLAMQDADDRSFPDRLKRQLAFLAGNPDCVAVSGNACYMDSDGNPLAGHSTLGGDVRPDPYAYPSAEPYLPQPFVMIRRDAVLAVGGYRELTNAEDTDLYWRLLSVGRLHNLPDVLGEYRMHQRSASSAAAKSGRISALSSQLSAISFRRRAAGEPDLAFSAELSQQLLALDGIAAMIDHVSSQLSEAERAYLGLAVAAKLLELASYRPYLLTADDCRFIRNALPDVQAGKNGHARLLLAYQQAHILLKLLRNGCWREAAAFRAPLSVYAGILPALVARKAKAVLQSLRQTGRASPA